jgi:hypothetical protein
MIMITGYGIKIIILLSVQWNAFNPWDFTQKHIIRAKQNGWYNKKYYFYDTILS